jgi:hypothetical protein
VLGKLRVSEAWVLSTTARRVYLICAIGSIYFIGLYLGVISAIAAAGAASLRNSPLLATVLRLSFVPGIVATATLWVAMWYYWFGFDKSHWAKKTLWFLLLLLFPPFGPVAYYLIVYRRADFDRYDKPANGAVGSSAGA